MKKIIFSAVFIILFGAYGFFLKKGSLSFLFKYDRAPHVSEAPVRPVLGAVRYRDGEYEGKEADAYFGIIKVMAKISEGKISDVVFLEFPTDRLTSVAVNERAMPLLRAKAIESQSAEVDIVSGATDSSKAFRESLKSALEAAAL